MELEIRDLVKRFGGIQALNGVSLRFSGNELVGLIGPNGSGKTTLVNTIGGIYRPDGGKILFSGRNIGHLKANEVVRHGVGPWRWRQRSRGIGTASGRRRGRTRRPGRAEWRRV